MVVSRRCEWFIGFGMAMFALGVLLASTWPSLFHAKIKNMMILRNGSMSYEIWRDIPIPIYLECFLFNITNAEELLAAKAVKVKVEQLGPYVFREIHKKVDISWNDNSTVTFWNQRWWYHQPELSNGTLSDVITNINPIIATVAYTVRNENIFLKMLVDAVMRSYHSNIFLSANASAWLFDGVKDPFLNLANQIPGLPYKIPFDRFGWFYMRNGSTSVDGVFVTNTGEAEFGKLGLTEMWQHSNRTLYSGGCGEVRGTTGELWALRPDQQEIELFASDLCSSMTLHKTGTVEQNGVAGVEFAGTDSLFDNGHKYQNMACHCEGLVARDCMAPGILNVSACHYGAPAFISLPHLAGVHGPYPDKIQGLHPSDDHNFKMAIEPVTGMPLYVRAQLQVNALVRHVRGISLMNQLPDADVMVPMFWFREDIKVTEQYSNFAKLALNVRFGMPYVFYVLMVCGLSLVCSGLWFYRITKFTVTRPREMDNMATQTFLTKEKVVRTLDRTQLRGSLRSH